jgi:hypothetical protein
MRYWKNKFLTHPVTAYCTTMNSEVTDVSGAGSSEPRTRQDFSLLSDIVPEDKELRRRLQMDRLEQVSRLEEAILFVNQGRAELKRLFVD